MAKGFFGLFSALFDAFLRTLAYFFKFFKTPVNVFFQSKKDYNARKKLRSSFLKERHKLYKRNDEVL